MNDIKLSYVVTTYNKLPYLKEVIRLLLQNKKEDEEIVITDGGSTDGTVEFLNKLYKENKIDQFISEKDRGEAHGYNKTFMMAKGDLIKVITDDDVFCYSSIQECRRFMEDNGEIDMMTGMAAITYLGQMGKVEPIEEFYQEYKKWESGRYERFYSNGLALLIRKSSLPLLGLFSHEYTYVDIEYTLRVSKWSNIAFCNKCIAVRVTNLQSKGVVNIEGNDEVHKLFSYYSYPTPSTWQPQKPTIKPLASRVKSYLSKIKKKLQGLPPFVSQKQPLMADVKDLDVEKFYKHYEKGLQTINGTFETKFSTKKT